MYHAGARTLCLSTLGAEIQRGTRLDRAASALSIRIRPPNPFDRHNSSAETTPDRLVVLWFAASSAFATALHDCNPAAYASLAKALHLPFLHHVSDCHGRSREVTYERSVRNLRISRKLGRRSVFCVPHLRRRNPSARLAPNPRATSSRSTAVGLGEQKCRKVESRSSIRKVVISTTDRRAREGCPT